MDAVSGATLTSLAIQEAIIHRLGGERPSLRFPDPLSPGDVRSLFSAVVALEPDAAHHSLWHVQGPNGVELGTILRTSPTADTIMGYQGPSDALIAFDNDDRVVGTAVGKSYDNEPYVSYVRDDAYFLNLFNGLRLRELAKFDLKAAEVEGVSGATMTSMAVAHGLVRAADEHAAALQRPPESPAHRLSVTARDLGTAGVVLAGVWLAFSPLRGQRLLRLGFQAVLIGYLGLINGDLLSQAMLVGWAQHGVPWRSALGLVLLTAAALLLPIATRCNVYCAHLCPHGAAQQLLKNRLPWRGSLSPRLARLLGWIPAALLAWCLTVAMTAWPFSLVDIEPFDAWVFRVAGWATLSIAVGGLVASLFVPMAYCRLGCPTGALLNYLRLHARSDQWTRRDAVALALLLLALSLGS